MPTALAPLIDRDHAAFMQEGVSVSVASCNADLIPIVARALGRRLVEPNACLRIEKTGRGRFSLCDNRPIELVAGAH